MRAPYKTDVTITFFLVALLIVIFGDTCSPKFIGALVSYLFKEQGKTNDKECGNSAICMLCAYYFYKNVLILMKQTFKN